MQEGLKKGEDLETDHLEGCVEGSVTGEIKTCHLYGDSKIQRKGRVRDLTFTPGTGVLELACESLPCTSLPNSAVSYIMLVA